ncbi:Nucleoporin nup49/NSP49 (Nuclear pore protein nup49/NSP49) [Coemansia spiralis]|uniref:Nucleoporin nup49/NSP49 (Nuclear pore protein nup49/NSP49) n=2 Tax=Coemansia TaxID=4863 RepID=A0A9W8G273_9FUNG|nr:hypothetical protein BX070DRAFT_62216 [Coemansia spiralis]KAJ1995305.1 Nucleoporin nup49/NSP49 (Nuclear pore protein nup49/NSP49) [Coemansia umbellata]KAJ2619486.1 Nucleoporin nup49/NSP49 (Nuclear pore protein nup49/NSP49) [Coemansia sp. RSA 1358]KAJ2671483.1 Nucleoporin nup49/NSP49 (Nuclear pore protein nup49/NSP49) [Coemansia spiralis]
MFGFKTPAANNTGMQMFGNSGAAFGGGTSNSEFGQSKPPSSSFGGAGVNAPTTFGGTNAGSSLFGTGNSAPTTNLFGASSSTKSTAPASSGFFGASTTTSAVAPTTNLFGASATASAAPASSGLFGASTTGTSTAPAPSSLFGASSTSAAPAPSSLFGAPSTSTAPASSGLFGASSVPAAPTTSLFGAPNTSAPSSFGAPASTPANITRKTKFVDLPTDMQKLLEAIEKQKQVQVQIGNSIMVGETEKDVRQLTQRVQRSLEQLEVVKMTLMGDQDHVENTKGNVQFAIKHAEKAASLVAHATDDGSWAQSGLTPLQVANRQRALLALQTPAPETDNSGHSSDPFEAVRRIQIASINYDVASEYYWAWVTRVEAAAVLLAERIDQLERHIAGAMAREDEDSGVRMSPKALADVLQYQNDAFLAIAGKVAALDDDMRRLGKKLGIKVGE